MSHTPFGGHSGSSAGSHVLMGLNPNAMMIIICVVYCDFCTLAPFSEPVIKDVGSPAHNCHHSSSHEMKRCIEQHLLRLQNNDKKKGRKTSIKTEEKMKKKNKPRRRCGEKKAIRSANKVTGLQRRVGK